MDTSVLSTLILSSSYEAMGRTTWQQAMTLLASGRAEVIERYEDRLIRSVSQTYHVPCVIRFLRGRRRWTHRAVRFSRRSVYARDRGTCQYCRQNIPLREATFDHVRPRSRGGPTTWENVVIACLKCNQRKANRTPDEARMRLMKEPTKPRSLPALLAAAAWRDGMPAAWRPYLFQSLSQRST